MSFALFGISAPVFWLGLMSLWIFWNKLHWIGGTGYVAFSEDPSGWFSHLIGPWVVLAMLYAAFYARVTRGNLSRRSARTTSARRAPRASARAR